MKKRIYRVMMNRTAADVVKGNDELWTVYATLQDAQDAKLALLKSKIAIAAWIE